MLDLAQSINTKKTKTMIFKSGLGKGKQETKYSPEFIEELDNVAMKNIYQYIGNETKH